jgi:hypothetical protein
MTTATGLTPSKEPSPMPKAKIVPSTERRTASKTKPKSAITRVVKSGLDLVPSKKFRGKRATMSDYARIDFKPWKREPDMGKTELFPSDEALTSLGVSGRIAYAIMLKSREDLIASHGKLDHAVVDQMMANLSDATERLKEIAHMVEAAYIRMLASAAAASKQGLKFKGVDDKPARRKAAS